LNSPIPVVQQIWHGDSIELAKHFQAKRLVKSVITDPPFGVDNQSNSAVTPHGRAAARKILNDESPEVAMRVFSDVMNSLIPGMRDESDIYVFTSWQVLEEWLAFTRKLFGEHGFVRKAILQWEKSGPGQGDLGTWGMGIEYILYYKRGSWDGNGKRRNCVLHHQQLPPAKLIHPHEKPTPLLVDLIKHSTDPGDCVVDPFGGSGSLARAARECGRSGVSIEKDKYNYDLAMKKFNELDTDIFAMEG
jgi:adenine-specific DNA-methyltransferase